MGYTCSRYLHNLPLSTHTSVTTSTDPPPRPHSLEIDAHASIRMVSLPESYRNTMACPEPHPKPPPPTLSLVPTLCQRNSPTTIIVQFSTSIISTHTYLTTILLLRRAVNPPPTTPPASRSLPLPSPPPPPRLF